MPVRLRRAQGKILQARFLQFLARGGGRERLFHKIEAVHPLQYPRRAADERRLARLHEQKQRHADLPAGGLCLGERERVALGLAERQQRAGEAEGRGGQADGGAQLHQALGEVAAAPLRQGGLQFFLERSFQRLGGAGVAQQAGKDADDVAVYGGGGFLEGDGDDRPRRVVADAGQLFPALRRIGEAFRRHDARRLLQVAGAGIIAEAFPQLQQPLFGAGCQRLHGGQGAQKADIVLLCRLYARLLEHDLRYPYAVWVGIFPPREVSLVFIVPGEQQLRQLPEHGRTRLSLQNLFHMYFILAQTAPKTNEKLTFFPFQCIMVGA